MPQRPGVHVEDEEDIYQKLRAVSMQNQAGIEDLEALEMAGQEADLVDPFSDSEEDEPVDMEMVFEAMKHVPLPDLDYPDQDDPIPGDPSRPEPFSAITASGLRDAGLPQGILKRKGNSMEAGPIKKKAGGTGRAPKRVKVEVQVNEHRSRTSPKQAAKAECTVGSATAAAAKVAAEVPPNVVTGGIVAETGPRPDFSLWTVDDDLLLKNAMEAGAAMEALGKGAMRFSRRFSMRELRERWRALLFDPEISAQAAARMVEAELAVSNILGPKTPNELKNPQELARKRRENSVRTLYYKKRKNLSSETVMAGKANGLAGSDLEGAHMLSNGSAVDMHMEMGSKHSLALDIMAMGLLDTGLLESLSPKEATTLDFEDQAFSQMFSLLAAGGVGAVIGALPAGTGIDTEQDLVAVIEDTQSRGTMYHLEGSRESMDGGVRTENGLLNSSSSFTSVSTQAATREQQISDSIVLSSCPVIHNHPCQGEDEENVSTFSVANIVVDGDLQLFKDCSKPSKPFSDVYSGEEDCKPTSCTGEVAGTAGLQMQEMPKPDINRSFSDQALGECSFPLRDSQGNNLSGICLGSENPLVGVAAGCQGADLVNSNSTMTLSLVKVGSSCEISLVSAIDHREGSIADTKIFCSSSMVRVDSPLGEVTDSTKFQEYVPWTSVDDDEDVNLDDGARGEDFTEVECNCGRLVQYTPGADECGDYDVCDETVADDQFYLNGQPDGFLPSALTAESCILDLEYKHGENNFDLGYSTFPPSLGLEPLVCTFNTEDTEIPNLDDVLPYPSSPSMLSSPSDEGEYMACTDSPNADADQDVDGDAEGEAEGEAELDANEIVKSPLRVDPLSIKHEPESFETFCEPNHDLTMLGPSVDRGERVREVVAAQQDEGLDFRSVALLSFPGSNVVSDQGNLCLSTLVHQKSIPHVYAEGEVQPANFGRAIESQTNTSLTMLYAPTVAPRQAKMVSPDGETVHLELDPCPMGDMSFVMPVAEKLPSSKGVQKPVEEPPEEVLESEDEMAHFSDIEAMILDMDLDPVADDEFSARAESRRTYRRHGRAFVRLEQAASAAMQRSLNAREALAILYGRHLKHYITQTEVLMGRATQDNAVHIDLGKEGRANKVSRQQAQIKLKDDGVFYLRNLGRRGLTVNNKAVETGQRAILGSNCLIEVGGMRFIFETNRKMVKEYIERRHQEQ